jgi:hypothetical protein
VTRLLAGLAGRLDDVATVAATTAGEPLRRLPAPSTRQLDRLAEMHQVRKERLYAS